MLEKMGKMQVAIFEAPLEKLYTDARHMMSKKWQNRHEVTMMKYKQQLEEKLARLVTVLRCQDRLSWSQELHRTYSSREGHRQQQRLCKEWRKIDPEDCS